MISSLSISRKVNLEWNEADRRQVDFHWPWSDLHAIFVSFLSDDSFEFSQRLSLYDFRVHYSGIIFLRRSASSRSVHGRIFSFSSSRELLLGELSTCKSLSSIEENSTPLFFFCLLQWDPSITTPPGLYFMTHLLEMLLNSLQVLNQTFGQCSLTLARFTNVIFMLILPWIIRQYLKKTKKEDEQVNDRTWAAGHDDLTGNRD